MEGHLPGGSVVLLDELLPLVERSLLNLLGGDLGALADAGVLGLLGSGEVGPGGLNDLGLGAEVSGGLNLGELPGLLGKDVEAGHGTGEGDTRNAEHFCLLKRKKVLMF